MQKLLIFFSKNISIFAIFYDQSFNDILTNRIVSFEQLSPENLLRWSILRNVSNMCSLLEVKGLLSLFYSVNIML